MNGHTVLLALLLCLLVTPAGADPPDAGRQGAVPLAADLLDPDPAVAARARTELLQLGAPLPAEVAPSVAEALRRCGYAHVDREAQVRELLVLALCVRPLSASLPAILESEGERLVTYSGGRGIELESLLRGQAWQSLASAGPEGVEAIAAALEREQDRERVRLLLGLLGPLIDVLEAEAMAAVPALRATLVHESPSCRLLAMRYLCELDPRPAIPELVPLIRDPDMAVSQAATLSLSSAGPAALHVLVGRPGWTEPGALRDLITSVGVEARRQGQLHWWVPLRANWGQLLSALLLLGASWLGLAYCLRRRPAAAPRWRITLGLCGMPALLCGLLVAAVCATEWVQPFLPRLPHSLVPLPVSAGLSTVLLASMPGLVLALTYHPERGAA